MDFNLNKQAFLKWLLKNFKHHNPSVNFLIDYIASNPKVIDLIKFSDNVNYAPRGLFISYNRNDQNPFIYYKDNHSYTYSDQAFHDIRLNAMNRHENYYLEVDIPNSYAELYRFNVYEENPYLPIDKDKQTQLEKALNQISIQAKIDQLNHQLNQSIEGHKFEEASYILQQIERLKGEYL